ncbi:hypothetical protein BDW62DRAFT_58951 [Aspergillus aurantiobrunneus]
MPCADFSTLPGHHHCAGPLDDIRPSRFPTILVCLEYLQVLNVNRLTLPSLLHLTYTMSYKSNYEPYTKQSLDSNELRPSEELLYPLGDLYPHVVALQLQTEDESAWSAAKNFSGYQDISYWAEVVSSPRPLPEHYSKRSLRRCSGEFVHDPRFLQPVFVTCSILFLVARVRYDQC